MSKKWIVNKVNEIYYLENKENYISLNIGLNETALRLKVNGAYETFIVMGNHKNLINGLKSDFDILTFFSENTNGFWSNDVKILIDYIDSNFIK